MSHASDGRRAELEALSTKQLKEALSAKGVPHEHCLEKSELLALLLSRAFASLWEQVIQSLLVCVLHDVDHFGERSRCHALHPRAPTRSHEPK